MKTAKGFIAAGCFFLFFQAGISAQVEPGEMINIPEGWFMMGNDSGSWEEKPAHPVYLPAYQIGKYEVTRGEYRKFIEAGGYENPEYWSPEGWVMEGRGRNCPRRHVRSCKICRAT